jgi:hypothetical protein
MPRREAASRDVHIVAVVLEVDHRPSAPITSLVAFKGNTASTRTKAMLAISIQRVALTA